MVEGLLYRSNILIINCIGDNMVFDQLVYHCHCIYDKKFMLIIC